MCDVILICINVLNCQISVAHLSFDIEEIFHKGGLI